MRRFVVLAAGAALLPAACQDSAGPEGSGMSRAEALHVAAFVAAASEGAAGTSMTSPGPDMQNPPVNFSHTHESTHPCPSGGDLTISFTVDGMIDEETQSMAADLEGSHVHASCAFPHNGLTLTLSGNPAIDFAASFAAAHGQPTEPFTHTVNGAFEWSASDGRSGSCTIAFSAITDLLEKHRTVAGSLCGHTFSQTTTWN